jgi:hypothetical protein
VDRALIVLFGVSSGLYKVSFGPADVEIYAHLGFSAVATAAFGLAQLVLALLCLPARTRRVGAVGLALCNTVATLALFAAGIQPFGWISWGFVAMAAALWWDQPSR